MLVIILLMLFCTVVLEMPVEWLLVILFMAILIGR